MSNASMSGAALEFARSIEVASIPEKLRCATCDKVAINAVKLPCCDSSICGDCKDTLTVTECPVCTHSPFSADTAINARSLRTTVNVFLKTEAKKRGMDIKGATLKPMPTAEPTPPVVEVPTVDVEPTPAPTGTGEAPVAPAEIEEPASDAEATPALVPEASIDATTAHSDAEAVPSDLKTIDAEQEDEDESDDDDDDDVIITTERPDGEEQQQQEQEQVRGQYDEQANAENNPDQNMSMNQQKSFGGFDQNMAGFGNGNFGNMGMNGFNPMMGMMGMGMPNMMGMPGMGMDPSMMFNGNFGGMGDMSAMMGMGMNGMGMGGDISGLGNFGGMNGPGFFPNQGNYMQSQNFGNAPRQNFFNERGYGGRGGRGFGRGARGNQFGRGRGGGFGYQQQQYGGQNSDFPPNAPTGPSGARQQTGANTMELASRRRGSPTYDAVQGPHGPSAESRDNSNSQDANGPQDNLTDTNVADGDTNATDESTGATRPDQSDVHSDARDVTQLGAEQNEGHSLEAEDHAQSVGANNMQSVVVAESGYDNFDDAQFEQQGQGSFNGRGGFRGRGGYANGGYPSRGTDSTELTPKPAPPVNAPTGPKALRQGLPNTGWVSRASLQKPTPTPTPVPQRSESQARSVEQPRIETAGERDYDARDRSATRPGSKHRSRDEKEHEVDDEYEDDDAYARRKERKRRERKDRERKYNDDDRTADKDEDSASRKHRSRSESRTDDSSRRRHRDKDDEHRSSRSHRARSQDRQRSRRHRSKSPAKEYTEDYDSRRKSKRDDKHDGYKDSRSTRKSSRRDDDYKYEDSKKDRSSRSSRHDRPSREDNYERPRPVIEPPSDELGFKIKGSTKNKKESMAPPSGFHRERSDRRNSSVAETTSADPYAEERARAQQNREAKEAQRRQSTNDTRSSLGKRSREYEDDSGVPTGPKGDRSRPKKGRKERRISYKYEDEVEMQ